MPERNHGGERIKELWVPFRSKTSTAIHRTEYGLISWQSAFIPDGQRLAIDVIGINTLLKASQLQFPIEIQSNNTPDLEEFEAIFNPNLFGGVASAVLEKITTRSRHPQPVAEFHYDRTANRGYMRINFNKIGDLVADNLPQKRDDPEFAKYYGIMVDRAIKSQMGNAINTNYLFQYPNAKILADENDRVLWGLIAASLPAVFGFLEIMINHNPTNALHDHILAIRNLEALWLIKGLIGLINPDSYGDYLRDKLLHGSLADKLQELYPHNFLSYFVLPYGVNMLWQKKFIKGISKS